MEISVTTDFGYSLNGYSPCGAPALTHADFGATMLRYTARAHAYNALVRRMRAEGAAHAQTLKATHRALFQDLVSQVRGQLARECQLFSDNPTALERNANEPYSLRTNNAKIAGRTGKNPATVWRNIERLLEAGIVERRVSHGPRADYELRISPRVLVLSDQSERNSEIAGIRPLPGAAIANCNPIDMYKNRININNIIIPVDSAQPIGAAPAGSAPHGTDGSNHGNRRKLRGEGGMAAGRGEKNLPPAHRQEQVSPAAAAIRFLQPKPRQTFSERVAELRAMFALWLVQYMVGVLFFRHNHYPQNLSRAVGHAEAYFERCSHHADFEAKYRELRWRVDAVARWVERTGFDMSNIYITDYLDTGNRTSGFANTAKWYASHLKYMRHKKFRKALTKRRSDRERLMAVLGELDTRYLSPGFGLADYIDAEAYVLRNIPHLHGDFMRLTEYIRYGCGRNRAQATQSA